jgi:hypothetical protein
MILLLVQGVYLFFGPAVMGSSGSLEQGHHFQRISHSHGRYSSSKERFDFQQQNSRRIQSFSRIRMSFDNLAWLFIGLP